MPSTVFKELKHDIQSRQEGTASSGCERNRHGTREDSGEADRCSDSSDRDESLVSESVMVYEVMTSFGLDSLYPHYTSARAYKPLFYRSQQARIPQTLNK